ncbi:unnamed protein product [Closterium sp. NIES-64]|nr:unnamed protein product [Closterium sp. NIES-64]
MQRLQGHANVVDLHSVYENDAFIFLLMELCPDGDLFKLISEQNGLPETEARYIFKRVALAVQHCHRNGIVHRDIKPENILLHDPSPPSDESSNAHSSLDGPICPLPHAHDAGSSAALACGCAPSREWGVKLADFGLSRLLPSRFRRSSRLPVAIGTASKASHGTRRFRCEAASSGDATSPSSSSSPPEPAATATPAAAAGGAKSHAFIHDFCFGITFGAAAAVAGVAWFLITKSADALRVTALFGATIALGGVGSLRAWRKGQSSTPYILGQAVLAAVLAYQAFVRLQVTGAIFPLGLGVAVSAAMVLFYIYVILAGGNPPPKKKAATAAA